MGSQVHTADSPPPSCRTTRQYGALRPWPTISTRYRSSLTRWLELRTSIVFPATRFTPLASQPSLDSRMSSRRLPEPFTPRMERLSGPVIACLFKEFQINASFDGLVHTVPGMNLDLLKMDKYVMDSAKDGLFRGEFPVVLEMIEKIKDGAKAK